MRKGGYYVNNTLLGKLTSERVDKWTSEQVDCEERQSNKGSGQGNEWIVEEVKITGEQG